MKNLVIPTNRVSDLLQLTVKLNNKANRLGFPRLEVEVVGKPYLRKQGIETTFDGESFTKEYDVEVVEIQFSDVDLGFDDYKLIGLTENVDGIDTLHNFTEGLVDLSEERGTCVCDHCNINRKRNKVYFVQKNGEVDFSRVGSTCVKDFFPINTEFILQKFKFIEEINNFISSAENEFWSDGDGPIVEYFKVADILNLTCHLADDFGYTSVSKAKEDDRLMSTRDQVLDVFFSGKKSLDLTTKDTFKGEAILEWFNNSNEESSYFDNCREIVSKGYCSSKLVGYVVGLYGAWSYFTQKQEAAKLNTSKHIEKTGKRQNFQGVIESVKTFDSPYGEGVGYITKVNCDGDIVIYFNQLKIKDFPYSSLEDFVGLEVNFDAAVKEHSEFNEVKQTQVSRATKVKLLETATV